MYSANNWLFYFLIQITNSIRMYLILDIVLSTQFKSVWAPYNILHVVAQKELFSLIPA